MREGKWSNVNSREVGEALAWHNLLLLGGLAAQKSSCYWLTLSQRVHCTDP